MLVVGTGIAGSILAYEAQKNKIDYLLINSQNNPLSNTSSLSNAHCRVIKDDELEKTIETSVEKFGERESVARFVYSQSYLVLKLFEELKINFERRAFGVIPTYNIKGGYVLLKALQKNLLNISNGTTLIDFKKSNSSFKVLLQKDGFFIEIESNRVVLATGGYGGSFENSDCFRYKNYNVFDMVSSNGGMIENLDSIFVHPFGYSKGKKILIGNEVKRGEFITQSGSPAFSAGFSTILRNNNYHERMDDLVEEIYNLKKSGQKLFFRDSQRLIEITPTVHYTGGGIKTDEFGRVENINGLSALGECRADGSKRGGRLPRYAFTAPIVQAIVLAKSF